MTDAVLIILGLILTACGLVVVRRGLALRADVRRAPAGPLTYEARVRALVAAPEWTPPPLAGVLRNERGR